MTQKYDKDFKLSAVQLYLSSQESIEKIATDLGVSRASLGKWVSSYKRDGDRSFPGSGHVVEKEIRALKQELHLVRQERDILKKAMAIFSQPCSKGMSS